MRGRLLKYRLQNLFLGGCRWSFPAALDCPVISFYLVTLGVQATSLEGPPLSKEEGWAMSDADTCEAALAALDAVSGGQAASCTGSLPCQS